MILFQMALSSGNLLRLTCRKIMFFIKSIGVNPMPRWLIVSNTFRASPISCVLI